MKSKTRITLTVVFSLFVAITRARAQSPSPSPPPDSINYNASKSNTGNATFSPTPSPAATKARETGAVTGRRRHTTMTSTAKSDMAVKGSGVPEHTAPQAHRRAQGGMATEKATTAQQVKPTPTPKEQYHPQ